ncbi:hypothetical protein M3603_05835 [Rummeliibacillus stabekisii]|uniref:hypothetical protein n=1 Tax=Rummeliibacillus stabekisii TaxID=241244 RepID=UPI00203C05CA|nr:hypothetical protein [Rummeliibacillus stabekisii]MCM3316193.1 hypothetical protein [Rummeliibacillus stabekisii]
MDKLELIKRLTEVTGNSLLLQFWSKSKADLTYESAKELKEEGKVKIGELTRRDDFSIHIQALS